MKRVPFLLLILLPATLSMAQKVDLVRESVTFILDEQHVAITAELVFKNSSSFAVSQMVFIPMPVRKEGLKRDTLVVQDMTANRFIKEPRIQPAGLIFALSFDPESQKKLRVCYMDDHNGTTFIYPMKMQADYWQGPLAYGSYTLKYDETVLVLDSTSMVPDNTVKEAEETILTWKRSNFIPEREFQIWFHKK